ncbi:MAG: TonB-dependent receptor [Sphingobacterium sp.]
MKSRKNNLRTFAILFLCQLFWLHTGWAQDTTAAQLDSIAIQEVQVLHKTEAKQTKEEPFNVNVIESKHHFNSSLNLNQLLTRTTGIRIREDGGLGSDFKFSLNGFSGKSVKFFLDGIPMDNFGPSLSLNNFPSNMAERIEIYKGVVPISLGADALGGAVNIITRSDANYLDASYSVGSFNTHQLGLNGAYTHAENGLALRFNGFYNYSDNNYKVEVRPIQDGQYLEEREVERFHDSYHARGAQFEVGVRDKRYADQLFLGVLAAENDKDIQTGVIMEQVYGAITRHSSSVIPTIKYKKDRLFTDGLSFNLYGAYNATRTSTIDTTGLTYNWLQETVPNSIGAERNRTQLVNRDREGLVNSNLTYAVTPDHRLALNYTLTDFVRKMSDVEDPLNVTHKMPQRLRKQLVGLGIDSKFGPLRTNVFAKYYLLHAESFENVSENNVPNYQEISSDRNNFGYGIAGTYFVGPGLQLKASYEHTYRLPEPAEFLGDGLFTIRNETLRPERSDNMNFGALYGFSLGQTHHFQTEANVIYRNSKDFIRLEQARNQPTGRRFVNVGDVQTSGVESEIRYDWRNLIFSRVNFSYQRIIDKTEFIYSSNLSGSSKTKNLNYGYKIPNIPYLFGNFDMGLRLQDLGGKGNQANVHYMVSFIEEYFLTPQQIGANNTDVIPQQVAHSIMADYSLSNGKYNIALECHNLFDSKLFDNYRLQKPGRSFTLKFRYFLHK